MKTQIVADVRTFPGHIACDEDSLSEIVIPVIVDGTLKGVLDIDSPVTDRFDMEDISGLETFVSILIKMLDWDRIC